MTTSAFSPAFVPIVNRLKRMKRSGSGYVACCPGHDDKAPSLSVTETASKKTPGARLLVLHCFTGCDLDAICRGLGIEKKDLFTKEPSRSNMQNLHNAQPTSTVEYELRNKDGKLVAVHVRVNLANGKRMWWKQPDGTKGLDGIPTTHLPLFGAHKLQEWREASTDTYPTLFVVEGEKAALSLQVRGIPAVGTVCGASAVPTAPVLEDIRGFEVFLWPDNDEAGRRHMEIVGAYLTRNGHVPGVVHWDDAPPKGDAADFPADRDPLLLINDATLWGGDGPDYGSIAASLIRAWEERTPVEEPLEDSGRKGGFAIPV